MLYTKSILYSCKGGRADEHWAKYAAEGIDLAQAARYFGARGGADAATQALLEKCAVPLLVAATPRAVWLEADPDSLTAAGILAGEDVAKHLEGCTAALLLAVWMPRSAGPVWATSPPVWHRMRWAPRWQNRLPRPLRLSCASGPPGRESI